MKEYEDIVKCAVKNVPKHFLDDARQAGYLGILNGLKKNNSPGYLFRCARNEIIKELGELQKPFALNKDVFCKILAFRRMKAYSNDDIFNTTDSSEINKITESN